MKLADWHNNPLSYLIDPVSHHDFFANYHEQRSLLSVHDQADRFSDLLTLDRIDEIIAYTELPPGSLRMVRQKPPINRKNYTFPNDNIDRGSVIRHYQQGATVVLNQLHYADEKLAHFCAALEQVFSCYVQSNIYLTPKNSQGLPAHYDGHDVFVLQLSGEKSWKLYQKPIDNPYRGEDFKVGKFETGEPVESFILNPGDCLYVPRGLMHEAESMDGESSLHITIGLIVKTWADLMLEAMSEVALNAPEFRRSLPPGFANQNFDRETARSYFEKLRDSFKNNASFDSVFEMFIDNFIRSRGADVRGGILTATEEINPEDRYIRKPFIQFRINEGDDDIVIIFAAGDIHFESAALAGLKQALSGEPFSPDAFADQDSESVKDSIRKLLAFGLIKKL